MIMPKRKPHSDQSPKKIEHISIMFTTGFIKLSFSVCLWIISLGIVWQFLSYNNFYYSTWYQLLDIDQTIASYSPQNRFGKRSFVNTNRMEHEKLFADIVEAINHGGDGLKKISYQAFNHQYLLLTKAEVIHLQDVANVITFMQKLVLGALAFGVLAGAIIYCKKIPITSLKKQYGIALIVIIILTLGIFITGAESFFYWLHELIFPDDHQWFFYYQDSIMSTMMQAPTIFAPISALLIALTVLLWGGLMALLRKILVGR